jgi:hypothetical protein
MSNTVRLIVALVFTGALAALATPELASKLPEGLGTVLAASLAAVLHKMNAEAPKPEHEHCNEDCGK